MSNIALTLLSQLTGRDHLKVLSQLQLHEYQLDEGASQSDRPHKQVGLLAQQVKAVLPNAVHETVSGKDTCGCIASILALASLEQAKNSGTSFT